MRISQGAGWPLSAVQQSPDPPPSIGKAPIEFGAYRQNGSPENKPASPLVTVLAYAYAIPVYSWLRFEALMGIRERREMYRRMDRTAGLKHHLETLVTSIEPKPKHGPQPSPFDQLRSDVEELLTGKPSPKPPANDFRFAHKAEVLAVLDQVEQALEANMNATDTGAITRHFARSLMHRINGALDMDRCPHEIPERVFTMADRYLTLSSLGGESNLAARTLDADSVKADFAGHPDPFIRRQAEKARERVASFYDRWENGAANRMSKWWNRQ